VPILAAILSTVSAALSLGLLSIGPPPPLFLAEFVLVGIVFVVAPFGIIMCHICRPIALEQSSVLSLPALLLALGNFWLAVGGFGELWIQFSSSAEKTEMILGAVSDLFAFAASLMFLIYAIVVRRRARHEMRHAQHRPMHNHIQAGTPEYQYQPVDPVGPAGGSGGSGSYGMRSSYGTVPINGNAPVAHTGPAPGVSYAYTGQEYEK
jgi:hypothetical protein